MTVLVAALALVVVLLAVLVVGLLRSHAEILRALHDLGINLEDGAPDRGPGTFELGTRNSRRGVTPSGTPASDRVGENGMGLPEDGPLGDAHDLMGVTPAGNGIAIGVRGSPGLTLLAFLSSGCMTCHDFWAAFGEPRNRQLGGGATRLVVIAKGPDSESPSELQQLADPELTTILSSEAWDDYSVPVAPYFVLVDGEQSRIVGEGAAASFDQLGSLISKAMADAGRGLGAARSRRDVLRGRRPDADEALAQAGIEPGHPSLHEDPQSDRGGH